ncbi:MAG: hypothetical protein Q9170_001399 [Blastenia crenularia]
MSSPKIILFDLPSKEPSKSWSLNVWKTRLILAYKSIPYTTHWLEYPDIAPHFKSLSIPPNDPSTARFLYIPYTVPTIRLPNDDTYVMDSKTIAAELERLHPSPPLQLDTPQQLQIEALWLQAMKILGPAIAPTAARNLLNERSRGYFVEAREKAWGVKLEEIEKQGDGKAWEELGPVLVEIGEVLGERGGPFVLGEEVSYADFILVGAMMFLKRIDERFYGKFVGVDPAFGRLFEAVKPWLEKDD